MVNNELSSMIDVLMRDVACPKSVLFSTVLLSIFHMTSLQSNDIINSMLHHYEKTLYAIR